MTFKQAIIKYLQENHHKLSSQGKWLKVYHEVSYTIPPDKTRNSKQASDYVRGIWKRLKKTKKELKGVEDNQPKVIVYDIETSLNMFTAFSTGNQYMRHTQLVTEPRIITIAYKWLGTDEIYCLTWEDGNDKYLIQAFLKEYNKADMVIGINNNAYDNKWIHTRAAKYDFDVNTMVVSYDIQKMAKKAFKLPSYSMAYLAKYFEVTLKQSNSGYKMWEALLFGTPGEKKVALEEMIEYNISDVKTTEELYFRLRKYFPHKLHFGSLYNNNKLSCPTCQSEDISLYSTTSTAAGTISRIMKCTCGHKFKISNTEYKKL